MSASVVPREGHKQNSGRLQRCLDQTVGGLLRIDGSRFAAKACMTNKQDGADVTATAPTEVVKDDRGNGDKTWSPEQGEQGISNRPDDESDRLPAGGGTTEEADDRSAFGNDDDEAADDNEDDDNEDHGV